MKVLSLFDGISCGKVAFERAGIPVEKYAAYEIEPNAIKVSKHNYPMIEQKGDVFDAIYEEREFDILIGGSPCTYWSIARCPNTEHKRETTSSGLGFELFMQYVRALKEAKPKYFLYENNESMSDAIKEEITKQLGVEPIMIDSADFSAQIRKRYYWTNIPVLLNWEQCELVFADIEYHANHKVCSFEKYKDSIRDNGCVVKWDSSGKGNYSQQNRARRTNAKMNTLPSSGNDKNNVYLGGTAFRKIHPIEAERLQTLPDNYTECIPSAIKRTELCGNGWTVDVIAHILSFLPDEYKKEKEKKEMELKVKTPTFPEVIEFNFEELKQEIAERSSAYVNLVYTDDQIPDAKKDRATLNKFVKVLSDERIKIKKECLKPYEDFEAKIKELDGIVNVAIKNIDGQIKAYEEHKKAEKIAQVKEYFESLPLIEGFETLSFEQIFNPRWENASTSMRAIQDEISGKINNIKSDLATLQNLPEFGFEATEVYKTTLDLSKAISEGQRLSEIAKRKAEQERLAAEAESAKNMNPPVEVETHVVECGVTGSIKTEVIKEEHAKQWVSFSALLSTEDAALLKQFFVSRGIDFKPI